MCFLFDHRLSGHKIWGEKTLKAKKKNVFPRLVITCTDSRCKEN